jgi:hypothetical protein
MSVQEENISIIDDDSGSRDIIKDLEAEREKQRSLASAAEEALVKEKKFWEVRNKARGLGYTDEQLREELKSWYTWTELKLERK